MLRLDLVTPQQDGFAGLAPFPDGDSAPASPESIDQLQEAIADHAGVPPTWIVPAPSIEALIAAMARERAARGPLIVFDPTDPEPEIIAASAGMAIERLTRSPRWTVELDPSVIPFFTPGATAFVQSPNDPTGTMLAHHEAIRLARGCGLLVIDERHAAYTPRSSVPLVREWDNVVVLRSLGDWRGAPHPGVSWAIARPAIAARIPSVGWSESGVAAALALLGQWPRVQRACEQVREERVRLFRQLRKLNIVQPYPSLANFLLVRVERGSAEGLHDALRERSIAVHLPAQSHLKGHLRITATTPAATARLREALIEIARLIED